nr:BURP domain-containing protein 16-like [Coffea arabica]
MSKLSFATVLFVIAFMLPAFITIGKGTPAPSVSFTASNQLKYWSLNVKNNMPPAILSKLSPLNEDDSTKKLVALTSKSTKGSGEMLTIGNIKQLNAKRVVSCHEVYLPFATYFCHMVSSTQLYAVDVVKPETKVPVNTVLAICHMDTSSWPTNHPAFEILKATPGKGEACHWITKTGLLWVGTGERLV